MFEPEVFQPQSIILLSEGNSKSKYATYVQYFIAKYYRYFLLLLPLAFECAILCVEYVTDGPLCALGGPLCIVAGILYWILQQKIVKSPNSLHFYISLLEDCPIPGLLC